MRIIAGSKKGMNLFSPKGDTSRPITDRIKESLFNVLFNYDLPVDKVVADVFSGVGSMGLEALSRGAKSVTFVEKDPRIIAVLRQNIEKAGFREKSRIVKANAFAVGASAAAGQFYDLVFVDPPYPLTQNVDLKSPLAGLLAVLEQQLSSDGLVMVRTDGRTELLERYGRFEVFDKRHWGTMIINLLRLKTDDKQTDSDKDNREIAK